MGAARHRNDVNQGAQKRAEDEDVEVELFRHHLEGEFRRTHHNIGTGTAGINKGTRKNPHQQGREHFLRDEGKSDSHDGRNNG